MFFEEMKKTEDTEDMRSYWREYREKLTDVIISQAECFHVKKELVEKKKLRLSKNQEVKGLILDQKPTLAIWGAGNCSDIDVERLSQYFQLVLIDCEMDKINKVSNESNFVHGCRCIDLKFWDVTDEDYCMFEAMLMDGTDVETIGEYLMELCNKMHSYNYNEFDGFDYSVVVGLASQLNARFMALLEMYCSEEKLKGRNVKKIYSVNERLYLTGIVNELNKKAVEVMFELVERLTHNLIIHGYEGAVDGREDFLHELSDDINEKWRGERIISELLNWMDCNRTKIMGAFELEGSIISLLKNASKNILFDFQSLVWNFTPEKNYLMMFFVLENG